MARARPPQSQWTADTEKAVAVSARTAATSFPALSTSRERFLKRRSRLPRKNALMLTLGGERVSVPLASCVAWIAPYPYGQELDIVEVPGRRWAIGAWKGRSAESPDIPGGYDPLCEVPLAAVVALCDVCNCDYPASRLFDRSTRAGDKTEPLEPNATHLQILETLASSKSRLTRPRLLAAMKRADLHPSEHSLRIELIRMRNARWVDNNQSERPRGFRITDLGRSILEAARRAAVWPVALLSEPR
jgi:hypothetical protein